jgi:hypothetical protein
VSDTSAQSAAPKHRQLATDSFSIITTISSWVAVPMAILVSRPGLPPIGSLLAKNLLDQLFHTAPVDKTSVVLGIS